jgi:hypothetical protein
MLAACITSTVLRREAPCTPSHRAFVYNTKALLLLPLEGYWESGTLGTATAKPNARYALPYGSHVRQV